MAQPVKESGRRTSGAKDGLPEILESSARLMAKQGFHGTSMRDLAEATGRSIAGLYYYFRNKEELLYLINHHGFSQVKRTLVGMLAELAEPEERLYALILNHVSYFALHRNEMRVMVWGTQSLGTEAARAINELKDGYARLGQEIVQTAVQRLTGSELEGPELETQTFLLFGMMNWTFGWYAPRRHGNVGELADEIHTTFLHGVAGERRALPQGTAIQKLFKNHRPTKLWDAEEAT